MITNPLFFSSGGQKPPKFLLLGAQALESTDVKDSVIISLRETDLTDYFSARAWTYTADYEQPLWFRSSSSVPKKKCARKNGKNKAGPPIAQTQGNSFQSKFLCTGKNFSILKID